MRTWRFVRDAQRMLDTCPKPPTARPRGSARCSRSGLGRSRVSSAGMLVILASVSAFWSLPLIAAESQGFRIHQASITPGGARTGSIPFDIWGCMANVAAGRSMSTNSSIVLQAGCSALRKAAASVDANELPVPIVQFNVLPSTPNPFRRSTSIRYQLPAEREVRLEIYAPSGRLVRRIVQGLEGAGWHEVGWDGRDAAGHQSASGVYFYKLHAGPDTDVGRLLLIK